MEMGLLAAAVLIMVNELLSPQPRMLWLAAGVVLAVTTRFEALFYVGMLALSVVSVPGRRAFRVIVCTCLGTVLLLTCWRLAVFSDVLPNTYWAKRWPPYAASGLDGPGEGRRGVAQILLGAPGRDGDRPTFRFRSRGRAAAPSHRVDSRRADFGRRASSVVWSANRGAIGDGCRTSRSPWPCCGARSCSRPG